MATITPGHTFSEHELPEASSLHALIESASLNNVRNADLAAGNRIINAITPGASITGDILVGSDYLLDIYYSSAYNNQPDDSITLTLNDGSGSGVLLGAPVMILPGTPTSYKLMAGEIFKKYPIGVATAAFGAGVAATIKTRGFAYVRILGTFSAGDFIEHIPATNNCTITSTPSSNSFAVALESGGSGGSVTTCWSRILK